MGRIYSVKPFQVTDLATPFNINIRYTPVPPPPVEANDTDNSALVAMPQVVTQTLFKDSDTKHNEVVMLQGRPQGDKIVMEYETTTCQILKQNLIAVYQLQFEGDNVNVGANDDLMLQICVNNNGRPRLRKCKWIQRDINGGETEVDLRFSESRVGGLSENDLVQYIHAEERMQKSDENEEKRQEIKNSLEENLFQFKDELTCSEDGIKGQKAWKECMQFVSNIENQITNNKDYENDSYTHKRETNIKSPRQAPSHSAYNVALILFLQYFHGHFRHTNNIFPHNIPGIIGIVIIVILDLV